MDINDVGESAVVYIAKVRILEQITTSNMAASIRGRCCLYSKGKNFRANHNDKILFKLHSIAVVYIAKVRILEQITTIFRNSQVSGSLLFI